MLMKEMLILVTSTDLLNSLSIFVIFQNYIQQTQRYAF